MDSVKVHLKPGNLERAWLHFLLFYLDFWMSLLFQVVHIYFFIVAEFKEENNHVLHVLIGAGFTTIILIYSITDGIRFLRSYFDKLLYLIACLLQKPILLPLMFPSRFRSRIAVRHLETHTVKLVQKLEYKGKLVTDEKKILPTNFLLAVQETNFLYSFTLSGFVASTTACTILIENNFSDE
mmetsp:Transcript_4170/g.7069  ORF Transcript_4170/g.7069 Transcript_4170/m.7069 type:complete len:182 (-) Transcript_4170:285-830(-)|eukprot:CAMPEP_0168622574 /NCGR_PEP_ID=MMETSP0449_2-20121227/8344_1 /TAXON_ID=1082188 /ORGANISM="Strombidium rassoulzadegani, Strain ras09" /LENGTH=181 /DNA_ID=CAMNT_0008663857 /DNA_START=318 /DNA_END=863 /DNA_ORIENTATION=+